MIKLGIIGCGDIVHLYNGFSTSVLQAKGLEVTALVDVQIENAQQFSQQFPKALISTEITPSILSNTDAFLIAAPNFLHFEYGKQCLSANKHVLMEKPLALTEADCRELISISQKNHVTLMIALCMRYHPLLLKFKRLIDEKYAGELFQLSIWTEMYYEFSSEHWQAKQKTIGGGQLFSHGCHYIDLLMWILGHPIDGFFMGTNKATPWMEGEGTSHVCLKFKNDALGYYFGTWGARGTRNDYLMQAHCSGGMIEANFTQSTLKLYSKGNVHDTKQFYTGYTKETVLFSESIDMREMYQNEMLHFLDCIQNKSLPLTNGETSLESLKIIWQLYQQGKISTALKYKNLSCVGAIANNHSA